MGFLVQPQFVQFNDNEELPVNVQNRYFLYYSTGIVGFGGIPAMYVELESAGKLFDFVKAFSQNINIILTGTPDFVINKDYYINKSLYFTLMELPDTGSSDDLDDYFISDEVSDINMSELNGSSEQYSNYLPNYIDNYWLNVDYFNNIDNFNTLNYYIKKNSYLDYVFTEDELHNFYSTFCSIILLISVYNPTTNIDMIYKRTLEYFRYFKSDEAAIGITLILGSLYGSVDNNKVGCGCNTIGNNNTDIQCSKSCIDYYKDAMNEYLKSMLGDYTFYQNWFFIQNEDETIVNQELIDKIKTFITEFLSLDLDISTDKKQTSNCNCPSVDLSSDKCNRGIIENYLKVIEYIEQNQIEENINKIKIYGEQFAELLPKLQF